MARIPDRDGKDAHQPFDKCLAKLEVEAGDNGDVNSLFDDPPTPGKPRPQLMMVVNFAIADQGETGLWIGNRLLAVMHAADRQSRCAQHR